MSFFENIPYKKEFIIKDNFKNQNARIVLSRHFCTTDKYDRYYLRAQLKEEEQRENQGFLYFYIDKDLKESKFIGLGIKEKYRDLKLGSLLISSWIDLSLTEGFSNLNTNVKQKKPFLLHMLKKYSFEVENINTYFTSTKTVHICKKNNNYNHKYISFANQQEERRFKNSNIMKTDNYEIVNENDDDVEIIDSVVLYSPYYLQDQEKAYQKVLQSYQKHQ